MASMTQQRVKMIIYFTTGHADMVTVSNGYTFDDQDSADIAVDAIVKGHARSGGTLITIYCGPGNKDKAAVNTSLIRSLYTSVIEE